MNNNRKAILGVPVDICEFKEFILRIEQLFDTPQVKTILAVNAEKIMLAQKDPELLMALKEADFLIPDGIGTVIGLKSIYGRKISQIFRVTGIELMCYLLNLADKKKYKVFIFGATPQINSRVSIDILKLYPHLNLAGTKHGYIPESSYESLIEEINSRETEILFAGLGSPKQEKWIRQYKNLLRVKICMGIGGSLDAIAGKVPRAPLWIQNLGLEWLYRLIRQPSRIKRQIALPKFALEVMKEKMSFRNRT